MMKPKLSKRFSNICVIKPLIFHINPKQDIFGCFFKCPWGTTKIWSVYLIYIIKQDIMNIYVAYSRPNGWTERAEFFLGTLMGGWGMFQAKTNRTFFFKLFFHGQRRALQLVYFKIFISLTLSICTFLLLQKV